MLSKFREVLALTPDERRFYLRYRRYGESHEIVMEKIQRIRERTHDDRGTINLMW